MYSICVFGTGAIIMVVAFLSGCSGAADSASTSSSGRTSVVVTPANASVYQGGQVLMAGGGDSTAELYDPMAGSFSTTGAMQTSRSGYLAAMLQDGMVLITGGNGFPPTRNSRALQVILLSAYRFGSYLCNLRSTHVKD
jgi:hypothetical protein